MIRFIKRKYLSSGSRRAAGLALSLFGMGCNLLLFLLKLTAGSISGSIAITADGFNNLADIGSCLMSLLGFALSGLRPCRKYPFGYGRVEYLSGLFISAVVLILGARMTVSSVEKIFLPQSVNGEPCVLVILSISIAIKGYMYLCNKKIGGEIDSACMRAAAVDSLSDCAATLAIIAALIVERLTGMNIDGYTGAVVAALILWAGAASAKASIEPLLGMGIDEETRDRITKMIQHYGDITEVRELSLHDYGPRRKLLTMYIVVNAPARDTAKALRDDIRRELGYDSVIGIDEEIQSDGINTR